MLIGYARVSTKDQQLNLQEDALHKAGCKKIFKDVASGAKVERLGFKEALEFCRTGDTLVVWKLDRLSRSLRQLIDTILLLNEHQIGFKSLQENIDTTTSGGKLIFHIFSSLAEFERDIIRERTNAGLMAARARGKKGGRPKALDDKKLGMLKMLHGEQKNSIQDICKTLSIKRSTLFKYLKSADRTATR